MSVAALKEFREKPHDPSEETFLTVSHLFHDHSGTVLEEVARLPDYKSFLESLLETLGLGSWSAPFSEYFDFLWLLTQEPPTSVVGFSQRNTFTEWSSEVLQDYVQKNCTYKWVDSIPWWMSENFTPDTSSSYKPFLLYDAITGTGEYSHCQLAFRPERTPVVAYAPIMVLHILTYLSGYSWWFPRSPYILLGSLPPHVLEGIVLRYQEGCYSQPVSEILYQEFHIPKDLARLISSYLGDNIELLAPEVGIIFPSQLETKPRKSAHRGLKSETSIITTKDYFFRNLCDYTKAFERPKDWKLPPSDNPKMWFPDQGKKLQTSTFDKDSQYTLIYPDGTLLDWCTDQELLDRFGGASLRWQDRKDLVRWAFDEIRFRL